MEKEEGGHDQDQTLSRDQVCHLVDLTRQHTRASYTDSAAALVAIAENLAALLPHLQPLAQSISEHVLNNASAGDSDSSTHNSPDFVRACDIFGELVAYSDDGQQRNWEIQNDRPIVAEYLHELKDILERASASVTRCALRQRRYAGVLAAARLYQMEVNSEVRQCLAHVLALCCALLLDVISVVLNQTSLPSELARELSVCLSSGDMDGAHRAGLLLSAVLSSGQPVSLTQTELLCDSFTSLLLDSMEKENGSDEAAHFPLPDEFRQLLISLLLALNLQAHGFRHSSVVQQLAKRQNAKYLIESCLFLVNSNEDPVRMFEDHLPAPDNSVIRLLTDLFCEPSTARLFYTNDVHVLVDILLHNLCDLSPDDQSRLQYLRLCDHVTQTDVYAEHSHRREELVERLRLICSEDVSFHGQQSGAHLMAARIMTRLQTELESWPPLPPSVNGPPS